MIYIATKESVGSLQMLAAEYGVSVFTLADYSPTNKANYTGENDYDVTKLMEFSDSNQISSRAIMEEADYFKCTVIVVARGYTWKFDERFTIIEERHFEQYLKDITQSVNILSNLRLQNYRCFVDTDLRFSDLTLLTGKNGTGKSAIIEALLLLRKSKLTGGVTSKDLYAKEAEGEDERIRISFEHIIGTEKESEISDEVTFSLCPSDTKNIIWDVDLSSDKKNVDIMGMIKRYPLFSNSLHHLTSERKKSKYVKNAKYVKNVGKKGQHVKAYIKMQRLNDVGVKALRHPATTSNNFYHNLGRYLLDVVPNLQDKKVVRQILPLLATLLSCKRGQMVILQNPEDSLHNSAQSLLGKMCAIAAANGVQVIVETHSDHFLNGVRVAAYHKRIKPESIAVTYLKSVENANATDTIFVWIDENGRYDNRPINFFDETNRQLTNLITTNVDVVNVWIDENGREDLSPKGFFDEFDNQLDILLGLDLL